MIAFDRDPVALQCFGRFTGGVGTCKIIEDGIARVRQKFDKEFSDFVESSLAIMLIENWAFIADTLSFKMDQIANEVFVDTVAPLSGLASMEKLENVRSA